MDSYIDLKALAEVLGVSLAAGAGLVALFGLGLVGVSSYTGNADADADADAAGTQRGNPAGLVLAVVCFAIVVVGVALGIYTILAS